jgi:microcystin-dependent protein
MAVLQTGQSFASGNQVTATKLQDIANLATFRTGTNQTADDSTIQVDGSGGYLKVKSLGITSNELATDSVITAKIQNGAVTSDKLNATAISVLMPTSTILSYAGSSAPTGYLLCNGASISRTTYSDLFAIIGTTYGVGDGSTTFNIPDLRGRVIAGQDDMGGSSANRLTNQSGGLDGDTLGATGGSEGHQLTESELAPHKHYAVKKNTTSTNDFITAGNEILASSGPASNINERYALTETLEGQPDTAITSSTGGDNAHNNVQPTIILNYIIKT